MGSGTRPVQTQLLLLLINNCHNIYISRLYLWVLLQNIPRLETTHDITTTSNTFRAGDVLCQYNSTFLYVHVSKMSPFHKVQHLVRPRPMMVHVHATGFFYGLRSIKVLSDVSFL